MDSFPFILAHGALGWWDDLVFLGIISIFFVIMLISWFRSRSMDYDQQDLMPPPPETSDPSDERFQLD